ncbi:hypothetical protein [Vibrio sp. LaRot3]|uniref:hypothetical protein n=1 Tax=Vibrio sp. LaRot3 TaxID=2998829 RepID=UPI0022CDFCB8|nr:hypothetical protein [Vibrio sp. LaRot3]
MRFAAFKPYDEALDDLFNDAECEVDTAFGEEEIVTTTTNKNARDKHKPFPKGLPR